MELFYIFLDSKPLFFLFHILHYAGPKPWTTDKQELWKTHQDKLDKITKYYWRYKEITPWSSIN